MSEHEQAAGVPAEVAQELPPELPRERPEGSSWEVPRELPVEFHGQGGEYFGIWIVNMLLSVATLGIYSAWAKVRTQQYFHRHTSIDGRAFDYHATGKQILIGRLIVVGVVVAFSLISTVAPGLSILFWLAAIGLTPWLINRSLRFTAAVTSWSNVRFRFQGQYGTAFRVYILMPILMVVTFYLAYPFLSRAFKRYTINRHSLGQLPLQFDSGIGPFYKAFAAAVASGIVIMGVVMFGSAMWVLAFQGPLLGDGGWTTLPQAGEEDGGFSIRHLYQFIPSLLFLVAILPARFIYTAFIRNTVYGRMSLGTRRFRSTVHPLAMVWIGLSNAVLTVVTVGLFIPWARVRMARYLAANTVMLPGGSLDEIVGAGMGEGTAVGDAYTDFEGVDVGVSL